MYINNNINFLSYLKDKELYIFGAGEKGEKVARKFLAHGYCVKNYIDNDPNKIGKEINNIGVISLDEFIRENHVNKEIIICSYRYEREISLQLLENHVHNFVHESQIDFGGGVEYYDKSYFEWQRPAGEFGAKVKKRLFQKYIEPDMTVLEFGCGGGFLLKELQAKEKMGIDVNDAAREFAQTIGVKCVKTVSEVEDGYADIIISNSALEHVENPLEVLRELHKKLNENGKAVFYVPNESCDTEYSRSDINNHLYTWNCLNIGNLFKAAGFFVHSVERVQEVWPANESIIEQEVSGELFDTLCAIGGKASNENRCLIVALKK